MTPTHGPRRDTELLKTALRPDFYEYFPVFSPEELDDRLARLPFCRATLLTERNIQGARTLGAAAERAFRRFLRSPFRTQRRRLADVLASVGTTDRTTEAVARVPRHRFVRRADTHLAYLNVHVPTGAGSCLTPPGLVALMLDRLGLQRGETVVEFGAGAGYHLACVAHLVGGEGRAAGVDVRFPRHLPRLARRVTLVHGDLGEPPFRPRCVDVAYTTCFTRRPPDSLASMVRASGRLQMIVPISEAEFESEPPHSWLRTTFGDHGSYLKGETQRYACVRTWSTAASHGLEPRDSLYDVTFVPESRPDTSPSEIRMPVLM